MTDACRAAMQAVPTHNQNPSWVKAQVLAAYDAKHDASIDVDRLAAAMNGAQIKAEEIALGHDLRVPARRILAVLAATSPVERRDAPRNCGDCGHAMTLHARRCDAVDDCPCITDNWYPIPRPTPSDAVEEAITAAWRLYWNVTDGDGKAYLPDPTILRLTRKALDALNPQEQP